jgi:hypothetical protein
VKNSRGLLQDTAKFLTLLDKIADNAGPVFRPESLYAGPNCDVFGSPGSPDTTYYNNACPPAGSTI